MTPNYLAPNIPAPWCSVRRAVALAVLLTGGALAQSLDGLAANYRKTPNPRTRAALIRYAGIHKNDQNGALALLVLGATEVDQRQFGDAVNHLKSAEKRLPKLGDYIAYLSAESQSELREFSATEATLSPVWLSTPASPLVSRSVALQVNSYLQNSEPQKALPLVQQHLKDLTEPQAELLLARANEAAGNSAEAAQHYQKIYMWYPLSKEAADASAALTRYPAPTPQQLLARGLKLVEAGDYARGRKELSALSAQLTGGDLDMARVRIGAALYLVRENKAAYEHLSSFQAATPEAEAERRYYLVECARRLDRIDEMSTTLDRLSQAYPQSIWRLQALVSVANYDSAHDQKDAAERLYRVCYETFPNASQAVNCHWKVSWAEYLRDPSAAATYLQEHLKRYPDSEQTTSALYFLGRIGESKADWGAARTYYDEINRTYPNSYYASLARERLAQPSLNGVAPSLATVQLLAAIQFNKRRPADSFVATATTKDRIERAKLLASAGLEDLAESELRFGAKVDGQPQLMAIELADLANRRDAPDQAIRYIKHYTPTYLSMSIDAAPDKFWRLAFPIPYRKSLEDYCRERSLDPYLVAALIRQESEFNAKAVSHSNARGLTQVMPATGRELSRKLGIRGFRTSMLFTPDTNLKIGTYYLKVLLDQLQGKWEETLASYNAGKSRVNSWVASTKFNEPAEFVESIPFTETRQYVQSVLRNAEMYRRLYGKQAH